MMDGISHDDHENGKESASTEDMKHTGYQRNRLKLYFVCNC